MKFMRRFGYLEKTSSDSESLYHESAIVEAVKNIQKYGALNQTGKLDNETLNVGFVLFISNIKLNLNQLRQLVDLSLFFYVCLHF